MTKSQLIQALYRKHPNLSIRKAELAVNTIFKSMSEALCRGNRIEVRGFGSFTVRKYKAYRGRNPRTGEPIKVKKKKAPFFKAGKELRDRINAK